LLSPELDLPEPDLPESGFEDSDFEELDEDSVPDELLDVLDDESDVDLESLLPELLELAELFEPDRLSVL
jgi:hypothetical protein